MNELPQDSGASIPGNGFHGPALDKLHRKTQEEATVDALVSDENHPYHFVHHVWSTDQGTQDSALEWCDQYLEHIKADIGWHDADVLESTKVEMDRLLKPMIKALLSECISAPDTCQQTVKERMTRYVVGKACDVLAAATQKQAVEFKQKSQSFSSVVKRAHQLMDDSISEVDQVPDATAALEGIGLDDDDQHQHQEAAMGTGQDSNVGNNDNDSNEQDGGEQGGTEYMQQSPLNTGVLSSKPVLEEDYLDFWRPDRVDEAVATMEQELRLLARDNIEVAQQIAQLLNEMKQHAAEVKEAGRVLGGCRIVQTNAESTLRQTAQKLFEMKVSDIEEAAITKWQGMPMSTDSARFEKEQHGTIDPRMLMPR